MLLILLSGCGGTGNARLAFADKSRGLSTLHNLGPASIVEKLSRVTVTSVDSFKMRFIAAYLAADVDENQNNVGAVAMFYLNPQCLGDINTCGIPGSGKTNLVTDYFDFTTAEVANTAINSSLTSVPTGTYKYVRLDFCESSVTGDQVQFKLAGMSSTQSARTGTCGITSLEADPPITIGGGGNITVTLSYDPKEFFTESNTDYGDGRCNADATPTPTGGYWCLSSIDGSASDPSTGIVPTFSGN